MGHQYEVYRQNYEKDNQMIDFLADMIEKYGDKIPKSDAEIRSKKTA